MKNSSGGNSSGIKDKVVVITGASSRIGEATALLLAARGANAFNAPLTIAPIVRPLLLAYFRSSSAVRGGSFNVTGTWSRELRLVDRVGRLPSGSDMLDALTNRTRVTTATPLRGVQHDAEVGRELRS